MAPPFPPELETHSPEDTWAEIQANNPEDISNLPDIIEQFNTGLRLDAEARRRQKQLADNEPAVPSPSPPPAHVDPDPIIVDDTTAQTEQDWVPAVPATIKLVWQWKKTAAEEDTSEPAADEAGEYEIEWIGAVGYSVHNSKARARVCVKWRGWPLDTVTWEPLWKVTDWSEVPETAMQLKTRVRDQAVDDGFGFEDLPDEDDQGNESESEPEAPEPPSRKRKASAGRGRGRSQRRGRGRGRGKARRS